ncbi:MAG: dethiobiotin synthase [Sulfuricurvum sp.]|nr:dethiobiotin synthase [Sulfuricurvum sp.]MDD5386782.1 dethiobiotin synthase [Sulfuricurvum sp.]
MPKRIFITATNTDIGKTYTTLQLLDAYTQMGYKVGVYKPIETGVNGLPADGSLLLKHVSTLNPALKSLKIGDIVSLALPLPAAPYVANKGAKIDLQVFDKALEKIEKLCDIVIIEGAGGLMVPLDEELMMYDLARHFDAITLLVTHCRLGCINDTLLSLERLKQLEIPHLWTFNCRQSEDDFIQTSLPYFKNNFESLYFIGHNTPALAQALLDKINLNNKESTCDI